MIGIPFNRGCTSLLLNSQHTKCLFSSKTSNQFQQTYSLPWNIPRCIIESKRTLSQYLSNLSSGRSNRVSHSFTVFACPISGKHTCKHVRLLCSTLNYEQLIFTRSSKTSNGTNAPIDIQRAILTVFFSAKHPRVSLARPTKRKNKEKRTN